MSVSDDMPRGSQAGTDASCPIGSDSLTPPTGSVDMAVLADSMVAALKGDKSALIAEIAGDLEHLEADRLVAIAQFVRFYATFPTAIDVAISGLALLRPDGARR